MTKRNVAQLMVLGEIALLRHNLTIDLEEQRERAFANAESGKMRQEVIANKKCQKYKIVNQTIELHVLIGELAARAQELGFSKTQREAKTR